MGARKQGDENMSLMPILMVAAVIIFLMLIVSKILKTMAHIAIAVITLLLVVLVLSRFLG